MAQQVGCGYSVVLTDGGGFDGNAGKPALFHRRDDINIHILGKDVRLLVDAVGAQIGLVEHTDQGPGIGVRPGRVNLKVGAQGGDQLLRRGTGGDIVQGLGGLYLLGGGQVQAAFQLPFHREGVEQPSQPGQGHAAPLLLVGQRGVAGVGEGGCR